MPVAEIILCDFGFFISKKGRSKQKYIRRSLKQNTANMSNKTPQNTQIVLYKQWLL